MPNKKAYERNIAEEFYEHAQGLGDDGFAKFMMYWVGFNWLYRGPESHGTERDQIRSFYMQNINSFDKYDPFCSPASTIFLQSPVNDMYFENTDRAKENFEKVKNHDPLGLLLTVYQVRCNLFHGSKSLRAERDMLLVDSAAEIMGQYLKVLIDDISVLH